jgi:hypothetical protein
MSVLPAAICIATLMSVLPAAICIATLMRMSHAWHLFSLIQIKCSFHSLPQLQRRSDTLVHPLPSGQGRWLPPALLCSHFWLWYLKSRPSPLSPLFEWFFASQCTCFCSRSQGRSSAQTCAYKYRGEKAKTCCHRCCEYLHKRWRAIPCEEETVATLHCTHQSRV